MGAGGDGGVGHYHAWFIIVGVAVFNLFGEKIKAFNLFGEFPLQSTEKKAVLLLFLHLQKNYLVITIDMH